MYKNTKFLLNTVCIWFQMQQMILYQIPLGTMGQPEDIAETASFLLSKKSKYITGTVIDVAGGLL